jgi:hypothetical protein
MCLGRGLEEGWWGRRNKRGELRSEDYRIISVEKRG